MYKVKAMRTTGPIVYACGTADQAYDRSLELQALGAQDIVVIDPNGKEWSATDFVRKVERES